MDGQTERRYDITALAFSVEQKKVTRPRSWEERQIPDKNSSVDEIANVNFYAVRPEAPQIR